MRAAKIKEILAVTLAGHVDLGGAVMGKVRVTKPMLTSANPCVLSDALIALVEGNSTMQATLVILHPDDSYQLTKTLQAKLPKSTGPKTTYYMDMVNKQLGVWSTLGSLSLFFLHVPSPL